MLIEEGRTPSGKVKEFLRKVSRLKQMKVFQVKQVIKEKPKLK